MPQKPNAPSQQQIYKVALASIVGSIIEQYDFLVTGVIAATIWGDVFFKLPKLAAAAAAISIYGIGIIIRPIGAYLFGHLADRYGRKDALVYALVLMGVSTLLIGLTPSYDTIGVIAPRVRVWIWLWRDSGLLYREFSDSLPRVGRQCRLSDLPGLRRRPDPDPCRTYSQGVRHSSGLSLHRTAGDGLCDTRDPCGDRDAREQGGQSRRYDGAELKSFRTAMTVMLSLCAQHHRS